MKRQDLHNYQIKTIDHILEHTHCGVFLDMGLGKTVSTLTAISDLKFETFDIDSVLVIAPKRVVESVWSAEALKWDHLKGLRISRIIGDERKRLAAVKAKADIYLLSRDNVAWFQSVFRSPAVLGKSVMLVVDESSSFKNAKTSRFKALRHMQPYFTRVCDLTGTPSPNGLIDLWPQIWLLDRGERLGKTLTAFRETFFSEGKRNGQVVFNYDLLDFSDDAISNAISDICISMKAEDYLDMPPAIYNDIIVDFPPALKAKYDKFEKDRVMEILGLEDGVSAMNAASLSNKLLQFAGGAIYDEDRNIHEIHRLKLDAAEEVIEMANGRPVLIAYTYKHELTRLMERLKAHSPVLLKTDQDVVDWNSGKIRIMIMHPASGGHGLNLQDGSNIALWYSCNWSLEIYQQFNKRLDRQGQQEQVIINRIIAKDTEDESVIAALDSKANTQERLMQSIKAKIDKYGKMLK